MPRLFTKLRGLDWPLAVVCLLLLVSGLVILYGISVVNQSASFFYRQLLVAIVGLGLAVLVAGYDYHRLVKLNRWVYIVSIMSLVFVLFFGRTAQGSSRWIDFGFFQFQPAELLKLVLVLGLARLFYLRRGEINAWRNVLVSMVYVALPAVLIILQPDLGSAGALCAIWAGLILLSPISKRTVGILLFVLAIGIGVVWQYGLRDYQRHRIEVFLDPELDPQGKGYNVRQAIIAVGSGQWAGRGLGQGLQSSLRFLPERHTDFIFATAAEEIGFFGSASLVVLFTCLLWRLVVLMQTTKDDLAYYILGGIFFMFFIQILVNIGMNMGIMPVTGIPLPFISYGRSALLVNMLAIGVVQNIAIQSKALRF
jgi:rod shape determining protein RodA